jgi:hypothetical protein
MLEDDASQPIREGGCLAQTGQVLQDLNEGVLGGILGAMEVAEDRPGVAHGHVLETPHQLGEGVQVAAAGAPDNGEDAVGR